MQPPPLPSAASAFCAATPSSDERAVSTTLNPRRASNRQIAKPIPLFPLYQMNKSYHFF